MCLFASCRKQSALELMISICINHQLKANVIEIIPRFRLNSLIWIIWQLQVLIWICITRNSSPGTNLRLAYIDLCSPSRWHATTYALAIHINIPSWTLIYFAQNIAQSNYIYWYSTVAATNGNDYSLRILMTRKNWIVADNKLLEPSCWFNCTLPAKANLRAIILA